MTVIVKTRQQRQTRLRRSLETTSSLSTFYWPDDFINHQPSDEFVECARRDISQRYRLIVFLVEFLSILFSRHPAHFPGRQF